jgi:sulfatase maturation enzyme AslB (radical SAM superfamily)
MHFTILYRGSLISCNYGCEYCPFAKRQQTAAELAIDKQALERFVNWIFQHPQHQFSILFTPWGEALIHKCYQQALVIRMVRYAIANAPYATSIFLCNNRV